MSISSAGIGSGIDINQLVNDLLANEGQAKSAKFDAEEAQNLAKITGYGTLSSALSEFQTRLESLNEASNFQKRSVTSEDDTKFTAIADNTASEGVYSLEVTALATKHTLGTAHFSNPSTVVGTGTLKFTVGTVEHSFDIDTSNQTLTGIKDKINQVSGTTGISATIVTTDSGSRIVFTATETGQENNFTVSVVADGDGNDTDNAGLSQLDSSYLTTLQTGTDATVLLYGETITSSSNTLEDVIDGVTIDLLDTNIGDAKTLTISLDKNATRANIQSFVDGYNTLMDTISSLNTVTGEDANQNGILVGDSTLRNLDIQIRRQISSSVSTVPGGFKSLAEIGITTDANTGKLLLNNTKLTEALDQDYDTVGLLFAKAEQGVAIKVNTVIDTYIGVNGIINNRTEGLNQSNALIVEAREQLERNLQSLESRLLSQFIAMDTIVAQMQNTGSFLTQQLSNFVEPLSYKK